MKQSMAATPPIFEVQAPVLDQDDVALVFDDTPDLSENTPMPSRSFFGAWTIEMVLFVLICVSVTGLEMEKLRQEAQRERTQQLYLEVQNDLNSALYDNTPPFGFSLSHSQADPNSFSLVPKSEQTKAWIKRLHEEKSALAWFRERHIFSGCIAQAAATEQKVDVTFAPHCKLPRAGVWADSTPYPIVGKPLKGSL